MAHTTPVMDEVPPSIFDKAWNRAVAGTKNWRRNRAKGQLEKQLYNIIETANGHQAKGLPAGHPAYGELMREANGKIDEFCSQWEIDRLHVEKEVPALRDLQALTVAPHPAAKVIQGVAVLIAVVVGAILIGCASGLIASGYHWTVGLLSR